MNGQTYVEGWMSGRLDVKSGPNVLFCMPTRMDEWALGHHHKGLNSKTRKSMKPREGPYRFLQKPHLEIIWLPNRDHMSYAACQIGPNVSFWFQLLGTPAASHDMHVTLLAALGNACFPRLWRRPTRPLAPTRDTCHPRRCNTSRRLWPR
jgi:hypothetical protein